MRFNYHALAVSMATWSLAASVTGFSAVAAAANCSVENATYGALRSEMAQKNTGTWVLLKDVKVDSNTIGYGPGGATAFEATFYDGKAWLAQADATEPDGVRGWHEYADDEGNVFAVTATAQSWLLVQDAPLISGLTDLSSALDRAVAELGCDTALLPFKVEGTARVVDWSIESNPEKMSGTYHDEPVVLVGIYSSADREAFFAVGNMNIHTHAIFPQKGFAGHVTRVEMAPAARIYLGQ